MMNKGDFGVSKYTAQILLLASCLVLSLVSLPSIAANKASTRPDVDQEVLKSKIKEVEASTTLDNPTKERLTEFYRNAITNLEKLRSHEEDAAIFARERETAPEETQKLQRKLSKKEKTQPEKTLKVSDKTPLAELEQLLHKEKADLAAVEAKLSDLGKRLEVEKNRPAAARERLITARRQQETTVADAKAPSPAGELKVMTQARRWALQTRAYALSAEIRMLDGELLSHQVRTDLLEVKKAITEEDVRFVETRLRILEDTLTGRRLAKAEQVTAEAQATLEEFKDRHPLVVQQAELNLKLGKGLRERALELERVSALDDQAGKSAKRISDDLSTIRQKLEVAGLSKALGQVLMRQRQTLPQLGVMKSENANTARLIAASSLQQIQYAEQRRELRGSNAFLDRLTAGLAVDEAQDIRKELDELLQKRRELLGKAVASESSYLRSLGELDLAQRELIDAVKNYDDFLGKRLLWIRSTEPLSIATFQSLPDELGRFVSPSNWLQTGKDLFRQLSSSLPGTMLVLALLVLTFMRRSFMRRAVEAGEKTGRVRTDKYMYTAETLVWTVLGSASLPLLLLAIGWQLSLIADAAEFTRAVSTGLLRISDDYLLVRLFADVAIPGGLVAMHFRWPGDIVAKLRHEFRILMILFLPCLFIVIFTRHLERAGLGSSLSILAVLFAVIAVGLFLFRIFTPNGGVLIHFLERRPASLWTRLRPLWLGLLAAYVIGLIMLVITGYLYTAGTLARDLVFTIWVVFTLILVRGMFLRWLLLVRRRLAYQAAVERREELRAEREEKLKAESEGKPIHQDDIPEVEEPEVDLAALDTDTRKLLDTSVLFATVIALWFIWSPVLPAFGILDDITLWSTVEIVDGVEKVVPITLASLALAIIVAITTVVAARGLPAFLEFILLQRMSITAGGRYTATTLLRYTIIGIGAIAFFNIIGAQWSKLQWLVAALGVGIGFGLQEIIANFISGLIILFERPIRIGDTVTVGDTTGVVSKINIRATTITNWDRQELLVPNKEFITTRLLNWSLTDPIIRVVIPVGVAYGSDVTRAMELLLQVAKEYPNVLEDPKPSVSFTSFGDNSLLLNLRAFLPSIDERTSIVTGLHMMINDKFNEAGIAISFPQRDVHLDGLGPIDVRLHNANVIAEDKQ
jgi:potassium efflux system protein